jgi:hypothetical protein
VVQVILNIEELKIQLKMLFENFNTIVCAQSEQIVKLDRRLADLENKAKINEKNKLIADLLDPLLKVEDKFEETIVFHYLMFFSISF